MEDLWKIYGEFMVYDSIVEHQFYQNILEHTSNTTEQNGDGLFDPKQLVWGWIKL